MNLAKRLKKFWNKYVGVVAAYKNKADACC